MGIDNIEILKPPPYSHDPDKCGGIGICLTCSAKAMQDETGR
jgi:hypothetical protein